MSDESDKPDWDAAQAGPLARAIDWVGDRLNPILVKETRQALKSRQFTLWFVLLLAACWITTIGGIALIGPSIRYVSAGGTMLVVYYLLLCLPLVVVVPFSAYRSLVSEQEENTRDLLEVSRLTPRQVLNGKLGSAMLQSVVFLSALAPCIAFTYLLRGVDVRVIALLLAYAVLASVFVTVVGLLIAAATKQKRVQVFMSVALTAGLFLVFWMLFGLAVALREISPRELYSKEFLVANLGFLSLYATTLAVVYCGAESLLNFASANRSTPLRVALVVQQAVFIGWIAGLCFVMSPAEQRMLLTAAAVYAAGYWFVAGAVMSSESSEISRRVRRTLPESWLGRVLFSWFGPGGGTGYVFSVANLATFLILAFVAYAYALGRVDTILLTNGSLLLSYVALYLGLGRVVVLGLRRWTEVTLIGGFLIQTLLLLAGAGLPFLAQTFSSRLRLANHPLLQLPSPVWVIGRVESGDIGVATSVVYAIVVGAVALVVLLVNLVIASGELRQTRLSAPQRVVVDDKEMDPRPEPGPTNPWGDLSSPEEA